MQLINTEKLLSCSEFRLKRDQFALDGYRLRWPILNDRRNAIRKRIATIDLLLTTYVVTDSCKREMGEERVLLKKESAEVSNQMEMIEIDAPLRKMSLGIIDIPPDLPRDLRIRVTISIVGKVSSEFLQGVPG